MSRDAVYGSVERSDKRPLSMQGQGYIPGDRTRRLHPLAFWREPGQPYIADRDRQLLEESRNRNRYGWFPA